LFRQEILKSFPALHQGTGKAEPPKTGLASNKGAGIVTLSRTTQVEVLDTAASSTGDDTAEAAIVFPSPNPRDVKLTPGLQVLVNSLQQVPKKATAAEQLRPVLDIALPFLAAVDKEQIFAFPV
jgi:hypothetical protein